MKVNHRLNAWIRANFDFIYEFGDYMWYWKEDTEGVCPMYKSDIVHFWIKHESIY